MTSLLSRPVSLLQRCLLLILLFKPLENLCNSSPQLSAALCSHARQYPWDPALRGWGGEQAWSVSLGYCRASLGQSRLPSERPNHGVRAHDTVRLVESMDSRDRSCLVSLPSGKMKCFGWVSGHFTYSKEEESSFGHSSYQTLGENLVPRTYELS